MEVCPKCNSKNIVKEEWRDTMPGAEKIGGVSAFGKTGDLSCVDCGYTSAPDQFKPKTSQS
jgi:predicted nucleic-acid-binding Zn-ribbon protein